MAVGLQPVRHRAGPSVSGPAISALRVVACRCPGDRCIRTDGRLRQLRRALSVCRRRRRRDAVIHSMTYARAAARRAPASSDVITRPNGPHIMSRAPARSRPARHAPAPGPCRAIHPRRTCAKSSRELYVIMTFGSCGRDASRRMEKNVKFDPPDARSTHDVTSPVSIGDRTSER